MTKHEIANAMRTVKAECNEIREVILTSNLSDKQLNSFLLYSLETIATAVRDLAVFE